MQKRAKQTLEAKDVHVVFGGLRALNGVNLTLSRGAILGLIGPNGAGKTTMVNVLSGFQRPHQGRVSLDGLDVSKLSPRKVAQAGIGRSVQAARLFRDMTVEENLMMGGFWLVS